MKFSNLKSIFISHRKYFYISFLIVPAIVVSTLVGSTIYNLARASFGGWGADGYVAACVGPRGALSLADSGACKTNETQYFWVKDIDVGSGLTKTSSTSGIILSLDNSANQDGWISAGETWTYASADDPTFTFTISGDKTNKYSPGMRVKLTQSSEKYFLITKVAYSNPDTTVTVYGGTDYDLADAAISSPTYSMVKAPHGFPLNPDKWTVEVSDTTQRIQNSPTQNTWYNLGSTSIDIPVGIWRVYYTVFLSNLTSTSTQHLVAYVTLSTSNNSESDSDFTSSLVGSHASTDSNPAFAGSTESKEKVLNLTSKTTYYLNTKTDQVNISAIYNNNNTSKMFIRAVSSYL